MANPSPEALDAWTVQFLADRRDTFSAPIDLAKVRAYCHKYEEHHLAGLPDPLLLVVSHQARMIDPLFSDEEREKSAEWLRTEGARIAADPEIQAEGERAMERQLAADGAAGQAILEELKRRP